MLTVTGDWLGGFASVLAFSMDPWVLLPTLALITFLLEDAAVAAGGALALNGTIGWAAAFAAGGGGITPRGLRPYRPGRPGGPLPPPRPPPSETGFPPAGAGPGRRSTGA